MDSENRYAVEGRRLGKTYKLGEQTIKALSGVDMAVEHGSFVSVMGPSGSGKSTLLHLLGLLDVPDEGEVRVGGVATRGLNDDDLTRLRRDQLGFVFQTFELIPNLDARENILLPAEVAGRRTEGEARLRELAADLGIADRLGHRPKQLSGGQRQRVALARALINDPVVVLADEPTGNLDTKTGEEIMHLFEHLFRRGNTLLVVTHEEEVARHARRIIRLRDGRIESDVRVDDPALASMDAPERATA